MIAKKKLPRSLRAEMIPLALGLLFSISCAPSLLRRAETLRNNQYYEEALDYYLRALKADPDRVEIKIAIDRLMKEAAQYHLLIGGEQLAAGKMKLAEASLKKALEFDP